MDTQATFLATLVDEWVLSGVTDAVVSPGNRSTLMSALMVADGRLNVHVLVDERSASFFALGLGMATGRPAIMWCTSGTATAELHAAVIEANQGMVPLLVCTADRPPELHHARDWQTVDQSRLYEGATRWHFAPGVADAAMADSWRSIAGRAVAETMRHPLGPGPVHLNLAIREPWTIEVGELPVARAGDDPWHAVIRAASSSEVVPSCQRLADNAGGHGVILVGKGEVDAGVVLALSQALGWPVLAEARSGVRVPHSSVVTAAEEILRSSWAERHRPSHVLRIGAPVLSKTVSQWIEAAGAEEWLVDPYATWVGPAPAAGYISRSDPTDFCRSLLRLVGDQSCISSSWLTDWQTAEQNAQAALASELETLSEPAVARRLTMIMPRGSNLFAATSMPVRDVEWYGVAREDLQVWANRGASGMDGVISTAAGVAMGSGEPTVLLIGDLTFLYDLNALWALRGTAQPVNLTVVVLDNDGGGIFSLLPQLQWMGTSDFERVVATPQGVDITAVAQALGVPTEAVSDLEGLTTAVSSSFEGGLRLIYVRSDRRHNAEVHEQLHRAVSAALQ